MMLRDKDYYAMLRVIETARALLVDTPHFAERCGPDYDEGCVCQVGLLAKALRALDTELDTGT